MNGLTGKGLFAAGALLATVTGWGYDMGDVVGEADVTANLDTRGDTPIVVSSVDEAFDLAWNNAADWRKGGDGEGAALTLIQTPMLAIPGGTDAWIANGATSTLVEEQTGEDTANYSPALGHGYRFDLYAGAELRETRFVAVGTEQLEARATVAVTNLALVAGQTIEPEIRVLEGKTVGTPVYRWYKYSFEEKWNEGEIVGNATNITLPEDEYEYGLRLLITDENGFVGMSGPVWISKLPVVYIETEGGVPVVGKTPDVAATMRMQGNAKFKKDKQLYSGTLKMHVRGNTTSSADKKPYKIKLDKKWDLLGLGDGTKNKHWVLLSNPFDISLMRNKVIYDLSERLGLTAMHSDWVDVILNGEFVGNYQLCQHIRVSEERVNIFDWEGEADDVAETIALAEEPEDKEAREALQDKLETYLEQNLQWITTCEFTCETNAYTHGDYGIDVSAYDKTGGYLFELSENEVATWWTGASKADGTVILDMPITANRPEFLATNPEMLGYAQEKWSNYWAAVISPDGYYMGRHYTDLCDVDSMTGYWLAQVIPAQGDFQWSRYAYIPQQKGITWGPAWDFDYSCGGRSINWVVTEGSGVTGGRANPSKGWSLATMRRAAAEFYCDWNNDPRFVQLLVEKFAAVEPYLDELLRDGGTFDQMYDYLKESGVANAERWAGRIGNPGDTYYVTLGTRFDDYPGVEGPNGYGDAHWFKYVLKNRVAWIKARFGSVRSGVAELSAVAGANPFTDAADKFSLAVTTKSMATPDSVEGATPDLIVPVEEMTATLTALSDGAKTVDVYVNGLSNGTVAVEEQVAGVTVPAGSLKPGERNMMTYVAKAADGTTLAKSYALLTATEPAKFPQALGDVENAHVEVERAAWTGAPVCPKVVIRTAGGKTLVENVDYVLSYANNVDPGTATVTATGTGNAKGKGEFGENGNWIGSKSLTFEIVKSTFDSNVLAVDFDTRANTVRKPESVDEILPFAWNNTAGWFAGGAPEGGNASVSVVPVNGEGADPMAWTDAGPARTFVDEPGEDTNAWDRQYAKLYRATLVQEEGAVTNTAFFDLRGLELPPDPVDFLREAFGDGVEIMLDAAGDPTVKLTDDLTGPVTLPAEVGAFTLDLAGRTLSGTNGVDGSEVTPGTAGGPAIVVTGAGVEIRVAGPGAIVGGKGGNGAPAGAGGEAIVGTATVVDPAGLIKRGADGEDIGGAVRVEIDEVRPCAPWNGDIEVRYTCRNLRAGARYDEVFHVTVNGVEKCVTNAVSTLDVGYTSISKSFVIDGEALFGANVKDNKAKVYVELVPIPPAE